MKKVFAAAAALIGLAVGADAWAAGIAVTTQAARATGMATAVTAGIDDASAAFYNPANMTRQKGFNLMIGDTMILPYVKAEPASTGVTTRVKTVPTFPPHLYATYGVDNVLSVGLALFSPYALALHWPTDWAGRNLVTDTALETVYLNPEIALRYECVRIGGGVQVVYGHVTLKNRPLIPTPLGVPVEGMLKVTDHAWGAGGNAALTIDLVPDRLSIGASWRSPVRLRFDNGSAEFSGLPPPLDPATLNGKATTTIRLPQTLALGLAVHPTEDLWLEFDSVYYGWQVFNELDVNFENPLTPSIHLPKNWKHIWNYHLGAEWAASPKFRVRLGAEYDPTPSPENTITPDVPDTNRLNFAGGLGYTTGHFSVDAGYLIVIFLNKTSTAPIFPAKYNGLAQVIGLTLGFSP